MTPNLIPPTPEPALPPRPPTDTKRILGGVWLGVLAMALLACGACAGIFYLISPLTSRNRSGDLDNNTALGSLALLGVLFGVVLVWQTIAVARDDERRTAASIFPPPFFLGMIFVAAILIGTVALQFQTFAVYVFPPWHFIAAGLVPLIFLAYAARRLGKQSSLRALFTAFSWGGLGATPLALVLELVIGLVFLLVAAVGLTLSPDSQALVDELQRTVLRSRGTLDPALGLQLITNPLIAGIILLYVAGLVPLVEESLKTLVVAFIDPRRTTLADAILWGIAAGAGFALVENIFNSSGDLNAWAITLLMRIGATAMHIANGVTMGRGWYAARVERRWGHLALAFSACLILHAVWNAAAIVLSGGAVFLSADASVATDSMLPLVALVGAMAVILIVLSIGALGWIVRAVQSAREQQTTPVVTTNP